MVGNRPEAELDAPAADGDVLQPIATFAWLDPDAEAAMPSSETRLGRRGRFVDGPDDGTRVAGRA